MNFLKKYPLYFLIVSAIAILFLSKELNNQEFWFKTVVFHFFFLLLIVCTFLFFKREIKLNHKKIWPKKWRHYPFIFSGLYLIFIFLPLSARFIFLVPGETIEIFVPDYSLEFCLFVIFIGPLLEEFFFRYQWIKIISSFYKTKVALWSSSAFFGLIHFYSDTSILSALIFGIISANIFIKYQNITLNIIIHSLYNFMGVVFTPVILTYLVFTSFDKLVISLMGLILGIIFLLIALTWKYRVKSSAKDNPPEVISKIL